MKITDLVKLVNSKLADEMLSYEELKPFLDKAIDDINEDLHAKYPVFSELSSLVEYNYLPDRYMRNVVATGAAYHFYVMDEEGERVASEYFVDYSRARFNMVRDFIELVPEEYQNNEGGYITHDWRF